jgi:hypothetical protein
MGKIDRGHKMAPSMGISSCAVAKDGGHCTQKKLLNEGGFSWTRQGFGFRFQRGQEFHLVRVLKVIINT